MKKRVNCPECNQEMNLMGLRWHRIAKHNVDPVKALILPSQADTQAVELTQKQAVEQKAPKAPQEVKGTMEQETNEQKPQESLSEIIRRELTAINLEQANKFELEQLRKENTTLKEQIKAVDDRPLEIPDLNTVIQHCESGECASHAKQWDQIKARIVQNAYDNLPPEAIPDKMVESEGLRRGFIPKKMIIPIIR